MHKKSPKEIEKKEERKTEKERETDRRMIGFVEPEEVQRNSFRAAMLSTRRTHGDKDVNCEQLR